MTFDSRARADDREHGVPLVGEGAHRLVPELTAIAEAPTTATVLGMDVG